MMDATPGIPTRLGAATAQLDAATHGVLTTICGLDAPMARRVEIAEFASAMLGSIRLWLSDGRAEQSLGLLGPGRPTTLREVVNGWRLCATDAANYGARQRQAILSQLLDQET